MTEEEAFLLAKGSPVAGFIMAALGHEKFPGMTEAWNAIYFPVSQSVRRTVSTSAGSDVVSQIYTEEIE